MREEFLWTERYRPRKISDTILPQSLKKVFQQFVDNGEVPNLLLSGGPGTGKTTVARAMLDELDADYILINGSLSGDMDTLRNQIQTYVSTVSFSGGRKTVILDEADYLGAKVMASLRGFIEEFSNCSFIFTCNHKNRIIEAIHSRCSCIDFSFSKDEKNELAAQFFKRICSILEKEKVTYDKKSVVELVKKYYPDGRRIINELQRYAASGSIDSGILASIGNSQLKELIPMMKDKNFAAVRKWIGENSDSSNDDLYWAFYNNCAQYFKPSTIPFLIITLAKYQYQEAFVTSPEINIAACLAEIMSEADFL